MNWHLLPLTEISQLLNTSPSGIDATDAAQRLIKYGKNEIEDIKKKTILKMLFHQFTDFMILILIAAAIISGVLGDVIDTIIILVVLNALVGFVQENRAEKAMEDLKSMAASNARVIRNGETIDIPASELVQGDVVSLEAGNILPADVRFSETYQVKVDESALTGESLYVEKNPSELPEKDYTLGDRINMGFKGTFISKGRALASVIATGMETELGHIAKMIQTDDIETPLQERLDTFGKKLSVVILMLCAVIFAIGWLRGESI